MLSWGSSQGLDVHTESYLVLTGTMPGKGRAWERFSINGQVHFLFLGRVRVSRRDSLLAHYKALGALAKIADLALIRVVGIRNMSLFFLSYQTQKPCPKEGNRKPFVISGLGWSLRCFSKFMVHSSLSYPTP